MDKFSHSQRQSGFSLVEMMVTIAVVGILAALAVAGFSDVFESSSLTHAQRLNAQLNNAVKTHAQTNWEFPTAKDDSATTDEFLVLRSLQYKPAASSGRFDPNAPYFSPKWNPPASSDTTHYRVRWNGVNFRLLPPGTAGTGLKLSLDGSDYTAADFSFPANYVPVGP